MRRLLVACGLCAWLLAGAAVAQVPEAGVWPRADRYLWYSIEPKTDYAPGEVDAVFKAALAEGAAFLDPHFGVTVFLARQFRLTKGKPGDRKKYPDRPEKADDLRIETEWRTGDMNQYRGSSYCFIALDAIGGMDLHFEPNLRARFPKAPDGRKWNVNLLAGSLYNFFFATEETARGFINAVASLLKQRGLELKFSRFGLMWENMTAAQAADLGPVAAGRNGPPGGAGVLVTSVAIAGAADRAGIRPLDVALEVNGAKVKNFSHFSLLLDGIAPGSKATLLLLRRLKDPNLYPEQNAWNTLTVEMEAR
ncbi:MAG TPA: PDZ domain-containing protein [Acidobacteriota bacterium]